MRDHDSRLKQVAELGIFFFDNKKNMYVDIRQLKEMFNERIFKSIERLTAILNDLFGHYAILENMMVSLLMYAF